MRAEPATELDWLTALEQTLMAPGVPHPYVQEDLTWIRERRAQFERARWRIAVAGVTSCGKSTLINALCGEDILPRESRPTSEVLVSCTRGEPRRATVVFQDGRTEVMAGEQLTQSSLARYADEKYNSRNRYQVSEICLEYPEFSLDHGVEIIDSPGLDAFLLEHHEILTLRRLVPTADLVIYVTTTKANSDKKNLEALDAIGAEDKPVIVIQNFLDAVEPEITDGGRERRSRTEVAQRLRARVLHLLSQAKTTALRAAPVVQISAYQAMQSRCLGGVQAEKMWEQSRLGVLLQCLKDTCAGLEQRRQGRRVQRIRTEVGSLVRRLQADYDQLYAGSTAATEALLLDLSRRWRLVADHGRLYTDASGALAEALREMVAIFKRAVTVAHRPEDQATVISGAMVEVKAAGLRTQENVIRLLDSVERSEDKAFAAMNLTAEDKRRDTRALSDQAVPAVAYKEETYQVKRQRKKSNGFLGLGWAWRRLTGGSDYETWYEDRIRTVVDISASLRALDEYCKAMSQQMTSLLESWAGARQHCVQRLEAEAARLQRTLDQRRNKPASGEVLLRLMRELTTLSRSDDVDEQAGVAPLSIADSEGLGPFGPARTAMQMDRRDWQAVDMLLRLSDRPRRSYHEGFLNSLIANSPPLRRGTLVLWARDRMALDAFCEHCFGLQTDFATATSVSMEVSIPDLKVLRGFDSMLLVDGATVSDAQALGVQDRAGFVLLFLDLRQIGATQGHLAAPVEGALLRLPHGFVVQSVTDHLADGTLAVAYRDFTHMCQGVDTKPPHCLVNDRSPFYSALFHVANRHSWLAGIGEEQAALVELERLGRELITPQRWRLAGQFFREVAESASVVVSDALKGD